MKIVKLIFLFSFYLNSTRVYSQDIKVAIKDNKIELTSSSCEKLIKEVSQLSSETIQKTCKCTSNICRTEITNMLSPKMIDLLIKKNPTHHGPNCWNSVLFLKNIQPGITLSSNEITFWLSSPLCKRVTPESPKNGDIANIRYINRTATDRPNEYEESHSFIYLTETLAFTKDGPDKDWPYRITTHDEMLKKYDVKKNCFNTSTDQMLSHSECEAIVEFYRCDDFEDHVLKRAIDPEALKLRGDVKKLSNCLMDILFRENSPEAGLISFLSNNLQVINKLATDKLKIPKYEDLPKKLQENLSKAVDRKYDDDEEDSTDWIRDYYTQRFSMIARPEFKNSEVKNLINDVVLNFREQKIYNEPMESIDYLLWSNIFMTTQTMLEQVKILNE